MKVGVVGAGAMGSGIAQVAAQSGHTVVLYDPFSQSLDKARKGYDRIFSRMVEKGKLTQEEADEIVGRVKLTDSMDKLKDCGLVVEAIIEDLKIKQDVFKKIETLVPEDCILATNTSSLSVASIGAACNDASRVIGLHFFNPAPLMPLVEIVPAISTRSGLANEMVELMQEWKKIPVIAKDTPGFIVNRVARPFYGEALRIYEEGIADFATIDWAMTELGGFRMGPFTLMDYIGNDVNYAVTESVFEAFYYDPRYKPSFTQKRLAEAGWLGRKSGRGYYDYREGAEPSEPNKDNSLGEQVLTRILCMLINEAADALFWNVASREDLELAMTKGVNYPKGLMAWGEEIGWKKVADQIGLLHDKYGEDRYRVSPMVVELAS